MPNPYFKFKQFTVYHDRCAMKVTTDACFFGAWCAEEIAQLSFDDPTLLDIGAGSGLLSLMIAQKNKLHIDAVEIDEGAAMQAKENIADSPWTNHIEIFNEDILQFHPGKCYDIIVSNPPFYENELSSASKNKNVAHHSEELKISEVIKIISTRLEADGVFFLLYPYKREQEIINLLADNELFITKKILLRQTTQHSPSRAMIMGSKSEADESIITSAVIWNENKQYTERFVALLQEYYLHL